jgi:hypothetical protein
MPIDVHVYKYKYIIYSYVYVYIYIHKRFLYIYIYVYIYIYRINPIPAVVDTSSLCLTTVAQWSSYPTKQIFPHYRDKHVKVPLGQWVSVMYTCICIYIFMYRYINVKFFILLYSYCINILKYVFNIT